MSSIYLEETEEMNGPSLSSKRQEEHEPRAQNDHKKCFEVRESKPWNTTRLT